MVVKFTYQINKKENKLVYTYINEHGVKNVKIIPIRDENGDLTKEYLKEANKKKFKEYYAKLKAQKENKAVEEVKTEETKVEEAIVEVPVTETKAEVETEEIVETTDTVEEPVAEKVETTEIVAAEIVEPESTELMVPETKLAVIDYEEAPAELKKKKKFTWKKILLIAGLVGAGLFIASRFEGCGEKEATDTTISSTPTPGPTNEPEEEEEELKVSPTPTPVVIPTVEEQLEDSRYTEITTEAFEETVFNLQQELTNHGINLTGREVVDFVTLANFTHMQETNPELLKSIMGEETDPQQFITNASKIIGQTVYLEVTDKNEQVNWTIALMDETDRTIAEDYMNNVVYAAKEYAEGEPIIEGGTYATREEKRVYIESLIATGYIAKDFDKTVKSQEIGADFITDAIVTGILLNDNEIKQFVSTQEVEDELKVISSNKDNVSNLHALISTVGTNCEEKAKTLTLN